MFNVIENWKLLDKCGELGLESSIIGRHDPINDVYIVGSGALSFLEKGENVISYRLSELLLKMLK